MYDGGQVRLAGEGAPRLRGLDAAPRVHRHGRPCQVHPEPGWTPLTLNDPRDVNEHLTKSIRVAGK